MFPLFQDQNLHTSSFRHKSIGQLQANLVDCNFPVRQLITYLFCLFLYLLLLLEHVIFAHACNMKLGLTTVHHSHE